MNNDQKRLIAAFHMNLTTGTYNGELPGNMKELSREIVDTLLKDKDVFSLLDPRAFSIDDYGNARPSRRGMAVYYDMIDGIFNDNFKVPFHIFNNNSEFANTVLNTRSDIHSANEFVQETVLSLGSDLNLITAMKLLITVFNNIDTLLPEDEELNDVNREFIAVVANLANTLATTKAAEELYSEQTV